MRRAIAFVCFAPLVAVACMYSVPDVVADAGTIAADGSTTDATSSDGSATEDGPAFDAGPDFCSTVSPKPFLCDDFDKTPLLSQLGVINPLVAGQGTAVVDGTAFLSYPRALHLTTNAGQPTVRVTADFQKSAATMTVAFSVKFTGSPKIMGGFLISNGQGNEERILVQALANGDVTVTDTATFADGGTFVGTGHSTKSITWTEWTRVVLVFALDATADGGRSLSDSLTVGGTVVESAVPDGFVVLGDGLLALYGDPQPGSSCEVWFDNVLFDLEPPP